MRLLEYEQSLEKPLRQATVLLLLRDDEVLLAMKKRGFGSGKWNGVGGKADDGETIEETAIRETREEIKVTPLKPKKIAILNYHFPYEKSWGQQVHVFSATAWIGTPTETEEMNPQWFKIKEIPYDKMWIDDIVWMPRAFEGALIKGSFMFEEGEKIAEHYLNEVESLD